MEQKNYLGNYNRFGVHINNYPLLVKNNQITCFSPIMKCICFFTSDNCVRQLYYYMRGAKLVFITPDRWKLTWLGELIEFSRLSDLLDQNPHFSKQELLNYQERMGNCHYNSMHLLPFCNGKLVTGYIDSRGERGRIIHTWIETERGNVFDYSNNLSISKDDYYRLMHPQVLNIISKEEYLSDCDLFGDMDIPFSDKFYCLFRNELLDNLRATHLFDENESFQKKLHHQ